MTGLEELKAAYKHMSYDFGFSIDSISEGITKDEGWRLVFVCCAVGIEMGFIYDYFEENDPYADDIFFEGDPHVHFSIASYRAVTDFIETLQKYRSDKDTMEDFIEYLKEEIYEYNY